MKFLSFLKRRFGLSIFLLFIIVQIIGSINNVNLKYEVVFKGGATAALSSLILIGIILSVLGLNIYYAFSKTRFSKLWVKILVFSFLFPITLTAGLIAATQSVFSFPTNYAITKIKTQKLMNGEIITKNTHSNHGTHYKFDVKFKGVAKLIEIPASKELYGAKSIGDTIKVKSYWCTDGSICIKKGDVFSDVSY